MYYPIKLAINSQLETTTNKEEVIKVLTKNHLQYHDNEDKKLIQVFSRFEKNNKNDIEKECRSLVIDYNGKIINYTFNDPIYNNEARHHYLNLEDDEMKYYKSYDGTLVSVFHFNNEWFYSTRRCLDADKSIFKSEKSHYIMFMECIDEMGLDKDSFENCLNKEHTYHFVLIHHQNYHHVNYKNRFGENYKKLILINIRKQDNQYPIKFEYDNLKIMIKEVLLEKLILPEQVDGLSYIDKLNEKEFNNKYPEEEGIIINCYQNEKMEILKIQSIEYLFHQTMEIKNNLYHGMIKLYQNNNLKDCLNYTMFKDKNHLSFQNKNYDVVGIIDATFKVLTSEFLELFKLLWNVKTGKKQNETLYENLPDTFKDILFNIRGIYFVKKAKYIQAKKDNIIIDNKKDFILTISDIYHLLKNIDSHKIIELIKDRTKVINNNNSISSKCDKRTLYLINIFNQVI